MRRAVLVVAILLLAACSSADDAATAPTDADAAPTTTEAVEPAVTPQGFDTIGVTIREASDATRDFCLWLAATDAQRGQGLMGVTDLAGKAGMLFTFQTDTQSQFYMFQTVMPLSIAFFDSRGDFVSSTDMAPCPSSTADGCPTYPAAGQYRDAIEVPQGTLDDLGIGPGTALVARGSCPA